jgi:ketosteroid isomerase-like protein
VKIAREEKLMRSRWSVVVTWIAVAACLSACVSRSGSDEERGRIQHLLDTYLQSVKTADVALASTVWLQAPDVIAVTPLGRFQGWDKVRDDVYVNFLQKSFVERDLKPSNVHIDVNGDSAWAVFDWSFAGKLANGQPFTAKGWESHVYRKVGGAWRIVHLHYSDQMPQSQ